MTKKHFIMVGVLALLMLVYVVAFTGGPKSKTITTYDGKNVEVSADLTDEKIELIKQGEPEGPR